MNTIRQPPTPTSTERIAAAGVVALVAGLLLPHAASASVSRAILIWFPFSVLVGLLLGASARVSLRAAIKQALLPALLLPLAIAGHFLVRYLADWSKSPDQLPHEGPEFSAVSLDVLSPVVLVLLAIILVLVFAATLLVVSLASIGKRPLILSIVRAYKLGPDGFDRAKNTVIALAGLLSAVAAVVAMAL